MRAPGWLTARPVAHRGLHDIARGIVENMPAAAQAAIDGNFAIGGQLDVAFDGKVCRDRGVCGARHVLDNATRGIMQAAMGDRPFGQPVWRAHG